MLHRISFSFAFIGSPFLLIGHWSIYSTRVLTANLSEEQQQLFGVRLPIVRHIGKLRQAYLVCKWGDCSAATLRQPA